MAELKKIEFENEEQIRDFIEYCISFNGEWDDLDIDESIENCKRFGYIKKSDLEIAKKIYIKYLDYSIYINELEREIEKLKKND